MRKRKASTNDVGELHSLINQYFIDKMGAALNGEDIPPSLVAAAVKFVKDNNITADPENNEKFNELAKLMAKLNGNADEAHEYEEPAFV